MTLTNHIAPASPPAHLIAETWGIAGLEWGKEGHTIWPRFVKQPILAPAGCSMTPALRDSPPQTQSDPSTLQVCTTSVKLLCAFQLNWCPKRRTFFGFVFQSLSDSEILNSSPVQSALWCTEHVFDSFTENVFPSMFMDVDGLWMGLGPYKTIISG